MILPHIGRNYQGHLFAFVDLLFLLLAFLVLVLFFIKTERSSSQVELEQVQDRLATVEKEKSAVKATLAKLAPMIEQFALQERREVEMRRALAAREMRRRKRGTVRVTYRIRADGTIIHEDQEYDLQRFKAEVVDRYRAGHWVGFRAFAGASTPFGTVVRYRRKLLEGAGEFDTYWDNLTQKQ